MNAPVRPTALDLFCCAGGAAMGLHRAGFDVTGVDIRPQPRYPFRFVQADALAPPFDLTRFAFIWASPPCQRFTALLQARGLQDRHPDYIAATRTMLATSGVLYCIENVPRAPLRRDLVLTGCMFGLDTYRKRVFETNFFMMAPVPGKPFGPISRPGTETIVGHPGGHSRRDRRGERRMRGTIDRWRAIMGCPWMRGDELVEAVPPVYAEFIGRAAMRFLDAGQRGAA